MATATKAPATSLQLNEAHIKGARKTLGFKPRRRSYSGREHMASVHPVTNACRIFRVGEDAIVVTDGTYGYLPFHLSVLRDLLDRAESLPVTAEFRTDK